MKLWIGVLARMAFFSLALMWPAGSLVWWEAWAVVGLWTGFTVVMTIDLSRSDPELLAERMKPLPLQKDQALWDKILMSIFTILGIVLYVIPGLDVVRFQWSDRFPIWLEVTAMTIQFPCFWFLWWVLRENTHLSQVVKIEKEREHRVITTGPYAIVRHPMYTAVIVLLFALPVALGSRFGLIPAVFLTLLLILRTWLEDRTLQAELVGYPEYADSTRYRLVPGVW